jgi:hypothetical protein
MSDEEQNAPQMTDEADLCPEVEQESVVDGTSPGHGPLVVAEAAGSVPVTLHEPDAMLVAYQVTDTVNVPAGANNAHEWQLRDVALALYAAIEPRDALESVLARLVVGVGNGVMDCLSRSARNGDCLESRDVNLRHAIKGSLAVSEMVKAIDNHRGRDRQKVTVGQVNVQSGGQAIVGNVERRGPPEQATSPASALLAARDPDDDREKE